MIEPIDTSGPLRPLYICGSTASGKTALAIQIAQKFHGEIVNLDAYQIYRNLDILSAAPSKEELSIVPHHLFGILQASKDHDAQAHRVLASACIADIQARGKLPIAVGGSGMYLKFITHGPSPVPPSEEAVRAQLELHSEEELISQLTKLDPIGAEMTNLKNRRYLIRALEICLISGRPMSSIKTEWKASNLESQKHLRGILLQWDRDTLRSRIGQRTDQMFSDGVIDEVKSMNLCSSTCEKAIGIRDIRSHLAGELDLKTLRDKIFFATCQYAKRQRTWFSKEEWLLTLDPSHTIDWDSIYSKLELN